MSGVKGIRNVSTWMPVAIAILCHRTAPVVTFDASDSITNGFDASGIKSTGDLPNLSLSASNASWHSFVQVKGMSFLVRLFSGQARLTK